MDAAERFLSAVEGGLRSSFNPATNRRANHAGMQSSSYFSRSPPRTDHLMNSSIEPHYNDLEDDPPLDDFGKISVLSIIVESIN